MQLAAAKPLVAAPPRHAGVSGSRPRGAKPARPARHAAAAAGSSNGVPQPLTAATPTVVTDAAVPEGHQGLHGFLYGEGGAEEHETNRGYAFREVGGASVVWGRAGVARVCSAPCVLPPCRTWLQPWCGAWLDGPQKGWQPQPSRPCAGTPALQGEDDGASQVAVGAWLEAREGAKPVGVYALYDARRNLQYVGYARNMVLAVRVSPWVLPWAGSRRGG